ncbi:MAG: cation transporter, partial [Candidatus Promineifilaceae bacterium]
MSEQTFQITGMDCADCARSIEKGVAKLDGVALCRLNFTTETLRVDGSVDQETVVNRIRELGYNVAAPAAEQTAQPPAAFFPYLWQR